jgi:hypothetical protein
MGRLGEMFTFSVLSIVMILVCDCPIALWRELGRPSFLKEIFGLTHIYFIYYNYINITLTY